MTAPEVTPPLEDHDTSFLGHPKGLGYLAFTEAFERFSYYGMQALLALYLANYLLVGENSQTVALFGPFGSFMEALYGPVSGQALVSAIVGTYFSSVYLTPIFGGMIADRRLGKRRTALIGCI